MRGIVLKLLLLSMVLAVLSCGGSSSPPMETKQEAISNLMLMHNNARSTAGLALINAGSDTGIIGIAEEQAGYMASIGAGTNLDADGLTVAERISNLGPIVGVSYHDFQAVATSSDLVWNAISAEPTLNDCALDPDPNCCVYLSLEITGGKQYWCIIYASPLTAPPGG